MEQTTLETELAVLKRDVNNFSQFISKLDSAIEKISDASSSINRLLALHEQRIESLNQADRLLESKLEKNANNFDVEIKELHKHIRDNNKEILDKLKSSEDEIKDEIKSMKKSIDESLDETQESIKKTNNRIDVLDRWKWTIIGGAIVVGWLLSKVPFNVTF